MLDPDLLERNVCHEFTARYKPENSAWIEPLSEERSLNGKMLASELTFRHLHGQPLVFRGDLRPAKRACMWHAHLAVLTAQQRGWDVGGLEITPDHFGWASPIFEAKMRDTAMWAAMNAAAAVLPGWEGSPLEGQEEDGD